ncbi:MAG TPA: ABC transporter ATP-binding protein [Myxococcales bacterium]|nr:ABC transporter ATP-binding protein [Myxococcales bacterium]
MSRVLDIRNISVQVGGSRILHDVSLSLDRGEIYGLLGPNGAGKTTTTAAALGLLPLAGGTVRVFDVELATDAAAVRRRIGVLPDPNGFYDWMTAESYLAFFAALYGSVADGAEIRRRLAQVGLEAARGRTIGALSHGMRQRLGLARALVADPDLLVLDEPTNGLDPRGRREIHDLLLELSGERGVGILLCTHLLDDVERLCDRVGFIVEGRTVAEGGLGALLEAHERRARFRLRLAGQTPSGGTPPSDVRVVGREGEWTIVDVDPATRPDAAWRELLSRGWPIVEIGRAGGGLEDLYLALTERRSG